jgi:hypothetical protein
VVSFGQPIPVAFGSGFALLSGLARDDYANKYGLTRFAYNFTVEEAEARGLPSDYFIAEYEAVQASQSRPLEVKHSVLSVFAIDGIARDRERSARAMQLIRSDPVYYASICWVRVKRMLSYTEQRKLVPLDDPGTLRAFEASLAQGDSSAPNAVGALIWRLQSFFQTRFILPVALAGLVLIAGAGWRRTLLLSSVPLYYLTLQSLMWTEFRHALPIHISVFIAIGVAVVAVTDRWRKKTDTNRYTNSTSIMD